jgi:hypothetical protein
MSENERNDKEAQVVDTPAAHIQTLAELNNVDVRVGPMDDLVRVSIRSTQVNGVLFFEPEEAQSVADKMVLAAMEAEYDNPADHEPPVDG